MGILIFIFIVFLGAFSLGEIIRLNLGNNISIKPVDIAAVVLMLVWIIQGLKNWKNGLRLRDSLFLPIFFFVSAMCWSLLFNIKNFSQNEVLVAFSYILRWILYINLYFIVKSFPQKFKEKIIYLFIGVGALFIFFGFIQYFFYSSLRNLYYLGWDEHIYRMFSTFLDPNFAGAFFVLFFVFLLGIFLYLLKNKTNQVWLIALISFFSLASIYLTYSRSSLIMLAVSAFIFSILAKKLKWFFILILISVLFVFISSKNFYIENINLFRIASTEARIDSAKIAIQIIRDNPFLGVGFNTYRYAQIKYGFRNIMGSETSHADAGTDNSFLFVFATTGIIGLIFYLNLLWAILKKSYMNYRRYKDKDIQKYIAIVVVASLGGIIINSFFINSLFYTFIMIWMWILLGLRENN